MADLTTAGVKVYYGVAATRPTALTGYTPITGIQINSRPQSLNPHLTKQPSWPKPEWKTYIPGLMDVGGSLAFKANHTDAFVTVWETLVGAYADGYGRNNTRNNMVRNRNTWFDQIVLFQWRTGWVGLVGNRG